MKTASSWLAARPARASRASSSRSEKPQSTSSRVMVAPLPASTTSALPALPLPRLQKRISGRRSPGRGAGGGHFSSSASSLTMRLPMSPFSGAPLASSTETTVDDGLSDLTLTR